MMTKMSFVDALHLVRTVVQMAYALRPTYVCATLVLLKIAASREARTAYVANKVGSTLTNSEINFHLLIFSFSIVTAKDYAQ